MNLFLGLGWTGILCSVPFYYYFCVARKARVVTGSEKLSLFLTRHVSVLHRKYYPSILYWEGRLQTLFGLRKRFPNNHRISYTTRIILKMEDGGTAGLDILENDSNGVKLESNFIVILLPGMSSSSQTQYVKSLVESIVDFCKIPVAVLNSRGWGGVPLTTAKTICATSYEDLKETLAYLKCNYPEKRIIALGTSLGGLIVMHYLVDNPKESKENLVACITISTPYKAWATYNSANGGINGTINKRVAEGLTHIVKKNRDVLVKHGIANLAQIEKCKCVGEYDTCYTVPQYGYSSLKDYYDEADITGKLDKFQIPVISLSAYDDPLQPGVELPFKEAEESSNFALVVTSRGGHLGFLETLSSTPVHFVEKFVAQVIRALSQHSDEF